MPFLRRIRWLIFPVLLISGFWIGYAVGRRPLSDNTLKKDTDFQVRLGEGIFTRPLLECEIDQYALGRTELRFFKPDLEVLVDDLESRKNVDKVAVYFRDLDNGPWIGVEEDRRFTPASLFKVPLIIGCYKQAEKDPAFLDRVVRFNGLKDPVLAGQVYPPEEMLVVGRDYTVRQLIERTAVYSDNASAVLLYEVVDWDVMGEVCSDLGLDPAELLGVNRTLTAETYGRFFRVLYNATYLSRKDSEEVLEMFTRSTFREGLRAGVPRDVVVAHKFGERGERVGSGKRIQLHDCGIVYLSSRPYMLCVMTEGYEFSALAKAIAEVSRFVYTEVSGQQGQKGSW